MRKIKERGVKKRGKGSTEVKIQRERREEKEKRKGEEKLETNNGEG